MREVWGDFDNKIEILRADAYEQIQKQSEKAAKRVTKQVIEVIKNEPATAEEGE